MKDKGLAGRSGTRVVKGLLFVVFDRWCDSSLYMISQNPTKTAKNGLYHFFSSRNHGRFGLSSDENKFVCKTKSENQKLEVFVNFNHLVFTLV